MKRKLLEKHNKFIALILSLLGIGGACTFSGCAYGSPPGLEYGSPHATFKVHGKIVDEDNTGLPDIKVTMWQGVPDSSESNSTFADIDGTYAVFLEDWPSDKNYKIKFEDVDGELNGSFQALDTTVVFENPEYENGDGKWNSGETSKELNIKLKEEN